MCSDRRLPRTPSQSAYWLTGDVFLLCGSGIMMRFEVAPLWVYAILVEHGVFITRIVILVAFPLVPTWIADAKDVKRSASTVLTNEASRACAPRVIACGCTSVVASRLRCVARNDVPAIISPGLIA